MYYIVRARYKNTWSNKLMTSKKTKAIDRAEELAEKGMEIRIEVCKHEKVVAAQPGSDAWDIWAYCNAGP